MLGHALKPVVRKLQHAVVERVDIAPEVDRQFGRVHVLRFRDRRGSVLTGVVDVETEQVGALVSREYYKVSRVFHREIEILRVASRGRGQLQEIGGRLLLEELDGVAADVESLKTIVQRLEDQN